MVWLRFTLLLNLLQLKCQSFLFSRYLQILFCSTLWSSSNRFIYLKSTDTIYPQKKCSENNIGSLLLKKIEGKYLVSWLNVYCLNSQFQDFQKILPKYINGMKFFCHVKRFYEWKCKCHDGLLQRKQGQK